MHERNVHSQLISNIIRARNTSITVSPPARLLTQTQHCQHYRHNRRSTVTTTTSNTGRKPLPPYHSYNTAEHYRHNRHNNCSTVTAKTTTNIKSLSPQSQQQHNTTLSPHSTTSIIHDLTQYKNLGAALIGPQITRTHFWHCLPSHLTSVYLISSFAPSPSSPAMNWSTTFLALPEIWSNLVLIS